MTIILGSHLVGIQIEFLAIKFDEKLRIVRNTWLELIVDFD